MSDAPAAAPAPPPHPGLGVVETSHGSLLARDADGLLCHDAGEGAQTLLCYRPPAFPAVAFLLSQRPLRLRHDPWRSLVVPLRAWGDDTMAFTHPVTGLLLCAEAVGHGGQAGPGGTGRLVADRRQQGPWESFSLRARPIPDEDVSDTLEAIDQALPLCVSGPAMLGFLASSREIAPELLTALGRLLPPDHTAWLGASLLREPRGLDGLNARLLSDIWASQALPALIRWAAAPDHAPRVRRSGRDCDRLEHAGHDGLPVSFAQSLNVAARAAVVPRRTLCALACARNEGPYLLEWIAHHRALGVEHFFVYTNDNDDGSDDLLGALARAGEITWIVNDVPQDGRPQYKAYGHALQMLPEILDFAWALVLDLDEFAVVDPALHASLPDYLAWQERLAAAEGRGLDAVALAWGIHGSGGLARRDGRPLSERFPRRQAADRHVKSVIRPHRFLHSQAHFPIAPYGQPWEFRGAEGAPHPRERDGNAAAFSPDPGCERAWIAHYALKSAEEFAWRRSRNRGDHPVTASALSSLPSGDIAGFLAQHRDDWMVEDRRPAACVPALAAGIARLMALPDVGSAVAGIERAYAAQVEALRASMRASARFQVRGSPENRFLRAMAEAPDAAAPPQPAPVRMPGFFRLLSCDGAELFVSATSGTLVSAEDAGHDRIATMAVVPRARPELLVLMEATEEASAFALRAGALRNPLHVFETHWIGDHGHLTLLDPASGCFASAASRPGETSAPVAVDRAEPGEREAFTLEAVREIFVPQSVRERAAAFERALDSLPPASLAAALPASGAERGRQASPEGDAVGFLELLDAPTPFAASLLNALLPLLRLDQLRAAAAAVAGSDALCRRLAALFPADPWAGHALPALLPEGEGSGGRGLRLRLRPRRDGAEAGTRRASRRVVGEALDGVAAAGRAFRSFPHAMALQARSLVAPARGPCVVALVRNEGLALLEWIAFHRLLGIEAFYLYGNDSDDASDQLLAALSQNGVVVWLENEVPDGVSPRARAYGHAFGVLADVLDHRWALVIDADEFLVLDPDRFGSIDEFLSWQERRSVDAVALNWLTFGSHDPAARAGAPAASPHARPAPTPGAPAHGLLWPPLPVTQRNTCVLGPRHTGPAERRVKFLCRPSLVAKASAHAVWGDERHSLVCRDAAGHLLDPAGPEEAVLAGNLRTEAAAVHHYLYRSPAEWAWRRSRRGADERLDAHSALVMSAEDASRFVRQHQEADVVEDNRAIRGAPGLREAIAALRALPGVEAALAEVARASARRLDEIAEAYRTDPALAGWDETARRFLQLAGLPGPSR